MSQSNENMPTARSVSSVSDPQVELVIVFGQSGAGLSTALDVLEDIGFSSVDNLPLALADQLVALSVETEHQRLAISVDLRTTRVDSDAMLRLAENLKRSFDQRCQFVLITASHDELIKRYQATRRRHPLLTVHNSLSDAIADDRGFMQNIAHIADAKIDTTGMAPADFRTTLLTRLGMCPEKKMVLTIISFSYRKGLPDTADFVFDMRFLKNPHWEPELRIMTGRHQDVFKYVSADDGFLPFMNQVTALLSGMIDRLDKEGRPQLTLGFGCTGGKHRSVTAAEWLSAWAEDKNILYQTVHRELE